MLTSDSITRLSKVALTTAVMLFVVWQITPTVTVWHREHLTNQLAEEIAVAKDSEVKVPLRQMATLGEPALHQLVIAAASSRAAVSLTARQILSEKVATWQQLADSPAREREQLGSLTASLASSLAAQIDRLGPAGKQWAEHITLDLIEMAAALPADQTGPLLADCSNILAAIPPRGPKMRTVTAVSSRAAQTPALNAPQPKLESLTQTSEIPWSSTSEPQAKTALGFKARVTQLPSTSESTPTPKNSTWSPAWKGQQRPATRIPKDSADNTKSSLSKLTKVNTSKVIDVPSPLAMKNLTVDLQELSSEELLDRLSNSEFYEAGVIRKVLRERGFASRELVLLQRLDSSDVADRLKVLEDLSDLPAASARRVLRRLLEDQNAEVRLRALTAIATTNDPSISKLARELAVSDRDPRVSELASRILKQIR